MKKGLGFGKKIRQVRKKSGLNQSEFAKKIGCSRQSISNYENDEQLPSAKTMNVIIREFKLPLNYFTHGTNELEYAREQIEWFEDNTVGASKHVDTVFSFNKIIEEKDKRISFLEAELNRYRKMIDAIPNRLEKLLGNLINEGAKVAHSVTLSVA